MTYLNQCWKKGNAASPLYTTRPKQQPEDEGANSHRKLQLLPESKTRNRGAPLRLEACWREGLQRHSKAAPPPAPPGHGNGPRPLVTAVTVDQAQGGGRMDSDRCREGRSTSCNRRKEVTEVGMRLIENEEGGEAWSRLAVVVTVKGERRRWWQIEREGEGDGGFG